jgi:hypothetical protein
VDSAEREKAISHHVEVLMYHDTGDGEFRTAVRHFAEMWEDLVPDSGEAESGQGEILRAIGRLAGEDRRNGNINWDEFYEALVTFLRDYLPHEAVFDPTQQARIIHDLDLVAANGRAGLDQEEMRCVFGRLIMDGAALVKSQRSLVPRHQMARAVVREARGRKPWWRFW